MQKQLVALMAAIIMTIVSSKVLLVDSKAVEHQNKSDSIAVASLYSNETIMKVNETANMAEVEEETPEVTVEESIVTPEPIPYRLTSYYAGEGGTGTVTGSGLKTSNFEVNEKGWYTYQGKLVLAGATYACLNSKSGACGRYNNEIDGRHYFHYYDEVEVVIDGITYEGIILDSCGASMFVDENRLDLFVSGKEYAIDRGYRGNNTISVSFTD